VTLLHRTATDSSCTTWEDSQASRAPEECSDRFGNADVVLASLLGFCDGSQPSSGSGGTSDEVTLSLKRVKNQRRRRVAI
jgi:hypothetical protein